MLEFSCGSASLATILSFYLDRPTGEAEVIGILRERYSTREAWTARAETGFSLADLIFVAERLGFAAQAARIQADQLGRVAGPLIVHLDKGRWQHFSVLRATRNDVFYLADPIVGQGEWRETERALCRRDGVLLSARQLVPVEGRFVMVETRQTDIRLGRQDPALFRPPEGFRVIDPPPMPPQGGAGPPAPGPRR